MPLHYIAYKASEELEQKTQTLVDSCESENPPQEMGQQAAEVAHEMMNDAVEAYVLEPLEQISLSKVSKKLINTFSKVMISTSRALINKTISPLAPEDVRNLTDHMLDHHLQHDETHFVSFEVEENVLRRIEYILESTNDTNLEDNKEDFIEILQFIGRQSIEIFLLKPIELIEVGGFTRRFINISHKTMDHTIDNSVPKLVKNLHVDEFKAAVEVFREHLLTIE